MNEVLVESTFGERFSFSRLWQSLHGINEQDIDFARAVGKSKGAVSSYYRLADPPPKRTVDALAGRTGVVPAWLMYGGAIGAPAGFADWLRRQRAAPVAAKRRPPSVRVDPGEPADVTLRKLTEKRAAKTPARKRNRGKSA